MDIKEYQTEAAYTLNPEDKTESERLAVFTLGLCGEAGEVAEHVKKALAHGKELEHLKLTEELGDVLWYIAAIATTLGINLEKIARYNVLKLHARYPDGFPSHKSTIDDHNTPVED